MVDLDGCPQVPGDEVRDDSSGEEFGLQVPAKLETHLSVKRSNINETSQFKFNILLIERLLETFRTLILFLGCQIEALD